MSDRLTEWVSDTGLQPALPGVYEVDPDENSPWYSYWDGSMWGWISQSKREAARKDRRGWYYTCTWRGLAEDPKVTVDSKGSEA